MSKYSSEVISKATNKLFEDINLELEGKKPIKLIPQLMTQYEIGKKVNRETKIITFVTITSSLKLADIDFLVKNGYLEK